MAKKMYLVNGEKVDRMMAHRIVEDECERQWDENQAEEYGEWYEQDDDTKAEYYNEMWEDMVEECK